MVDTADKYIRGMKRGSRFLFHGSKDYDTHLKKIRDNIDSVTSKTDKTSDTQESTSKKPRLDLKTPE